jgi:Raf kinase inhibitor-like YbhB/YbcL family protein
VKVFCPALLSGKYIPTKYAHRGVKGGQNISLPIAWTEVPPDTKSFLVTVVDLHPKARNWVHWMVIDIPATHREIPERASGERTLLPGAARELRNSFGDMGYGGPQPPRGSGPHPYEITVWAVKDETLPLGPFATLGECTQALQGKNLASASVTGLFEQ